jgi:hypothetical protein
MPEPTHRSPPQAAALHQRHTVAHDRAVAIVAEAAADHGVLGAGERVGVGDAADVDQRIVELRGSWSLMTCAGTTLTDCEMSSGDAPERSVLALGIAR